MTIRVKDFVYAGVLMTIIVLLMTNPFIVKVTGEEGKSSWVWTKEFPKPSWWKWDKSYYPTKPVRGGIFQSASTRYIGLMNPNHWPVNDWATLSSFYDRLIYPEGKHRPIVPWLAKSWEYENDLTILMKLREGVT